MQKNLTKENLYVTAYGNVTGRHPQHLVARIHFQDSCAHRKIQDIGMLKQCDSFTA